MSETVSEPTKAPLAERTTVDLVKAAMSGWLGTALEFMDFQLYSLAAALVFKDLFFPEGSTGVAVMASMAVYGVGYFARPVGAWYFGRLGDRVGRKQVLFITITMMGVATTLIGCLPTYNQVGFLAPLLLVILRLVQGFGAGAEISGAAVMLAEYAPTRHRGVISSLVALGTNCGTLFASAVWGVLVAVMSEEALIAWGWRIPFLGSVLVMVAAVWIRIHLKETPVYEATQEELLEAYDQPIPEKKKDLEKVVVRPTAKISGKAFWFAFFLRFGQSGNSGMIQTYLVSFIVDFLLFPRSVATNVVIYSSLVGFVTVPLIGLLGDRFGRRAIYRTITVSAMILAFPLFHVIVSQEPGSLTFYVSYIALHNLSVLAFFSLENITMAEMFGSQRRYEALALSKEIPNLITAGMGPFVAATLVEVTKSWIPLACLMVFYSASTFLSSVFMPDTTGRDLTDPKDAA
ncbi:MULTISPECIES: MFS transporter [unclassified Actinobaculum]|uniref:MFS transporter n=1 Tax=unclassified Actinobaculum TaxID=2609299 RepID=UPI000D527804|nr:MULTISPECIES: MFS transporter [unclassified Actinobaculum]AWE42419.1 MFS transporter [Actinobaculum sp. 313]RTE48405.1 MFS transporter [Actinobaculum sp. 352]